MQKLSSWLREVVEYAHLTFLGWRTLAQKLAAYLLDWYAREPWQRHVFFFSGVALMLFVIPGWVEYDLALERTQTNTVPSNSRFLFALVGLALLFLYTLEIPFSGPLTFLLLGSATVLYILGFIFPNPLHTYLHAETNHSFTIWPYLTALPLLAGLLVAKAALRNPVLKLTDVKRFFKSGLSE